MKACIILSLAFALAAHAAPEPALKDAKNLSLRNEIGLAIERGLGFLKSKQAEDGSWSSTDHPALTAMPLLAFQRAPGGANLKNPPDFVKKGYAFLRGNAKPDGGIYNQALSNYNTSVSMMALLASGDPADEPLVLAARKFVGGQQASNMAKPETNGGFGYGPVGASPKRGHPDLDNTLIALEAIRTFEQLRPNAELATAKDLNWKEAIAFIARCQNNPKGNPESWVSPDPKDTGGFIYYPGFSNANAGKPVELEGGKQAWRSYGSMTYAGMLSLLYADVKKDDPRVGAALDWLKANYTLEENPGMEKAGYYYYLHLMTKGLTAAGTPTLDLKDGKKIDWKRETALKLLSLQKGDGSWANDVGRWMETDANLVTSYAVMALEMIYGQL